jgi:hypothetical protein
LVDKILSVIEEFAIAVPRMAAAVRATERQAATPGRRSLNR